MQLILPDRKSVRVSSRVADADRPANELAALGEVIMVELVQRMI